LWHKHIKQESAIDRAALKGWQLVLAKEGLKGLEKELASEYIGRKKRQEKTTPFGVNLMRSPVLYRAAQRICKHLMPSNCTSNGCLHKRCHICRNTPTKRPA